MNGWCLQEAVDGNFYFLQFFCFFFLKGISLVLSKAWFAKKFQLLIMVGDNSLRSQSGRVVKGSRSLLSFWVSFSHFIFLPLSKQASQFRANLFKDCLPISLFLSLCYLLALPSLREISDTPSMYKRMLGNGNAPFCTVHFLGQCQAPCVF